MDIIKAPNFLSQTKNKHLLLDTSIFIDGLINPSEFQKLFDELKDNKCALVTIVPVMVEFVKGAQNIQKFEIKKSYLEGIIDSYLPLREEALVNLEKLVKNYKEDGKSTSIVDFLLGSILAFYAPHVLLLTKNIHDFPTNIFKLESYFLLNHRKALQVYGVYSYYNRK